MLTSTYPEYNDKIDHAYLMAAVAFLKDTGSKFYKMLSKHYDILKPFCEQAGFNKITVESLKLLEYVTLLCESYPAAEDSDGCKDFKWILGFSTVEPVRLYLE